MTMNPVVAAKHILPVNALNSDGRTYGLYPGCSELQTLFGEGKLAFMTLAINGPDDTSTGRWIPITAIDQYFATAGHLVWRR